MVSSLQSIDNNILVPSAALICRCRACREKEKRGRSAERQGAWDIWFLIRKAIRRTYSVARF